MTISNVPDEWQNVSAELQQSIIDADAAVTTHRQGIARIFVIGKGLCDVQAEAMRAAHSESPKGDRYNDAWNRLMQPTQTLKTITHTTERAQYIWCYRHRALIEAWLQKLDDAQKLLKPGPRPSIRDRWSYPETLKKNYLKENDDPSGTPKKPPAEPRKGLKETLAETIAERDAAREENRRLKTEMEGPLMTSKDSPDSLVRSMTEWVTIKLTPTKRVDFIIAFNNTLLDPESPLFTTAQKRTLASRLAKLGSGGMNESKSTARNRKKIKTVEPVTEATL